MPSSKKLADICDNLPAVLRGLRQATRISASGESTLAREPEDGELSHVLDTLDEILYTLELNDPEIRRLSEPLRRAVTHAVMQSLIDRELRSLALRDDLTGLYNRRAFVALATQQIRAAARNAQPLLLFFADIDGLKRINDTLGHQQGDLAIVYAGEALERTFRDSDVVARLGGDEFAALVPRTSVRLEEIILRRLSKNLRGLRPSGLRFELSLSVGVARFDPDKFATLADLIEEADRAMYRQKRSVNAPKRHAAAR